MLRKHLAMKSRLQVVSFGWLVLAALAGCTTQRNPRYCGDGVCIDPAYPFCDVDGMFGDLQQQCVAVDCAPDAFVACRGDDELRCNATGTSYDVTRCELGCDAAGGCRLCEPNQTACTNGKVSTCDAAGNVVSSEACPLGCFADQPRCRELAPSNTLGAYLDMVPSPPDLVLTNAVIETRTGLVLEGTTHVAVPSFSVPASGNGVPLRVFVVSSLRLNGATVRLDDGDTRSAAGAALAIVARRELSISGTITVEPRAGSAVAGCGPVGPGGSFDDGNGRIVSSGGGGGGNATNGANGGDVTNRAAGGAKGPAAGSPELEPLGGGCSGGFSNSIGPGSYATGGGAIQLSSRTRVAIDATIDVRGAVGQVDSFDVGGGGAGGSILLEAPEVSLGERTKLLATGGGGAQACTTPSMTCGAGGFGATTTSPATPGMDVPYTTAANIYIASGGGGGGMGRIRINTSSGAYTKSSTTIEAGALTVGTIATR
jgi:hypothetical protein